MIDSEVLRKLQLEELDIVKMLGGFFHEHGLTWFLDSGTLLGAARHGGFIPWDDDMDIGMPRADYVRLLELAPDFLPNGYSIHTFDNTPGFAGMFAKVYRDGTEFETHETIEAGCKQGIFVDIFPYDVLSANDVVRQKQIKNALKWQSLSYLYHAKTIVVPHKGFLGKWEKRGCAVAHSIVSKFFSRDSIERRFLASIVPDEPSVDSFMTIFAWAKMTPISYSALVPTANIKFEGCEFPAPADVEGYLSNMYGDWRKLPAPEDRRTHLPQRLVFSDGTVWEQ